MTKIHASLTDLIGNTPLIELRRYAEHRKLGARILAKVEYLNPAGSVKDRIAWALIRDGELRGGLKPGGRIVDVTSGNTGIGLAAVAASRGYGAKFYASDNISPDKIRLLAHYGAEVVKVPNSFFLDPEALDKIAQRIRDENPEAYFTDQLGNPANPQVHYDTTGPEIWRDTGGAVDALVAGVGTGGTISGAGRFLKERNPGVRLVVAEPDESSLPTEENPYPAEIDGVHKVSEVDPASLPGNYDGAVVDEVLALSTAQAAATARALAQEEGLLAGLSAGAVIHAATRLAARPEFAGKSIVAVIPDSAERYLNAAAFR